MQESRKEIVQKLYDKSRSFLYSKNHSSNIIVFKEVELSPHLRCDILCITYEEQVIIIELKTCKQDFKSDNKWQKYMDYCDYFYFFSPRDIVPIDEIDNKVGLLYLDGNNVITIREASRLRPKFINGTWFKHLFKKLAFRKFAILKDAISLNDENIFF